MSNIISYIICFGVLPLLVMGLLGFLLRHLLGGMFGGKAEGDLSIEGEGHLRAESDKLRARIQELEGNVSAKDTEISGLTAKLSAAGAGALGAAALAGAAKASGDADGAASLSADASAADAGADDDESYALEWRNRYLAARVKYLEGRLTESEDAVKTAEASADAAKAEAASAKAASATSSKANSGKSGGGAAAAALAAGGAATLAAAGSAKAKPAAKKAPAKKAAAKPAAKKTAAKNPAAKKPAAKASAKAAAKPKVLYTDGPTDGAPDDLKEIKGIGPKFEKDLNSKGIYYFRQIANWKKADVKMVEGVIDSIPGRIERDEWVKQAKGLAKSGGKAAAKSTSSRKKPGPKAGTKRGATNLDGTPRKKPGPKSGSGKSTAKKSGTDYAKYYADVQKFDKGANRDTVETIVKYCGIALRTRDGSLVACSDPTEVATVAKNFGMKKLGLDKDTAEKMAQDTCVEMKPSRFKNRVTFYYLMAKRAGKLSVFNK